VVAGFAETPCAERDCVRYDVGLVQFSRAFKRTTAPLRAVMKPEKTWSCAGVPISPLTPNEACAVLVECGVKGPVGPMDVHLCNAYTLALADKSPEYREILRESALNLPDGMSVMWANRLLHRRQIASRQRVRGTDLFLNVVSVGNDKQLRHYLLGSTPDVLKSLSHNLRKRCPAVLIVGSESPPFRDLTDRECEEQIQRITESRAQIVWVGLGTPKQDFETIRLARRIPVVFVAVGAAFDFVAGNKHEAPMWMQRAGMEWFHRLISEPRRLWRRYLFGNARFLKAVIRHRNDR
jgi:N-acetylglucosaminyldiphosphoundecaprenol N-acetyl-beta-D-mannosaminyltransferase